MPKASIGVAKLKVKVPKPVRKNRPAEVVLKPHIRPQVELADVTPPVMPTPPGRAFSKLMRLAPGTAALNCAAAATELFIWAPFDTASSTPV